jgi:sigma-B regulation protein RsbU (phosphoserine phosphatase)
MPPTQTPVPPHRPRDLGDFFGRFGKRVDDFWQRVTEGLEISALWVQFVREARASYSLYSHEVDWEALERESHARRVLKTASALFWAMILKLSPARRVFLLAALVLGVLSTLQVRVGGPSQAPPSGGPNVLQIVALGALVFLLALELADRVTMKRDLEIAREIQRWLVPDVPPRVPGVDIAFASRPANTVGGDYYDAFVSDADKTAVDANRLLVVVADVAGKSVPAALLMATFQASLRTLASTPVSLPELVTGLNHYACAHSLGGRRFTTAFFAELNPTTRAVTYVRAGHTVPILRRASGQFERLETGSPPLGIDAAVRFECGSTVLNSGDLLVIFTDGLVEAVNERDEEFSEPRVLEVLRASPPANAEDTLKNLLAAADAFTGRARQYDDITCLVLRVA